MYLEASGDLRVVDTYTQFLRNTSKHRPPSPAGLPLAPPHSVGPAGQPLCHGDDQPSPPPWQALRGGQEGGGGWRARRRRFRHPRRRAAPPRRVPAAMGEDRPAPGPAALRRPRPFPRPSSSPRPAAGGAARGRRGARVRQAAARGRRHCVPRRPRWVATGRPLATPASVGPAVPAARRRAGADR
jgi:hypothetical protein